LTELPNLSDEDKRALAERLVRDGYLRQDDRGRYWLTPTGHCAGAMLAAVAMWHAQEGDQPH
jgi:DNA-binding IclR family transcriptional regulator